MPQCPFLQSAFVFFLRHNSELPALSGETATQKGKKIAASFRFHFKSERLNYKGEFKNDDDDVGDSAAATDDDLRSNMARSITLWGGIIIPSGAHCCTFAHSHFVAHLHICTLLHVGYWTSDFGALCCTLSPGVI